jgi:uncharacterized membrane protein YeaQ/YmgE (transglycosylase-associated protein family)
MNKLLGMLGATVGGYVGWFVGGRFGVMAAFMVSMVGTGVGLYAARRLAQHVLG